MTKLAGQDGGQGGRASPGGSIPRPGPKAGALDLSKPGNLAAFMPKRPAALVDAKDDRVVLDLMKIPAIADNPKVKQALAVATPVVGVRAIKTRDDHLDVHLKADLSGLSAAIAAARGRV